MGNIRNSCWIEMSCNHNKYQDECLSFADSEIVHLLLIHSFIHLALQSWKGFWRIAVIASTDEPSFMSFHLLALAMLVDGVLRSSLTLRFCASLHNQNRNSLPLPFFSFKFRTVKHMFSKTHSHYCQDWSLSVQSCFEWVPSFPHFFITLWRLSKWSVPSLFRKWDQV
jgi:hypothetical protein